jgi:hypothetical protein
MRVALEREPSAVWSGATRIEIILGVDRAAILFVGNIKF